MAITAAITLSHPVAIGSDPQTSITLSNVINQNTGLPLWSSGTSAFVGNFNAWLTVTNTFAVAVNVVSVQMYAIPHGQTPVMGQATTAAAVTFGYANIGPTQVITVPASGTLLLQAIPGNALSPMDLVGENYGSPSSWSTSLVVSAAGTYIINAGPGGLTGGGFRGFSLNTGTTASSGKGPGGGAGKPILDGNVYWIHGKQQVYDICCELRTSDGSVTFVNPTAGGSATLTVQATRPE